MKTVVEQMLDELESFTLKDDIVYMHFESRRAYWMEKEKKQIIDAVEWNYKSNMGKVYYDAMYKENRENDVLKVAERLYYEHQTPPNGR